MGLDLEIPVSAVGIRVDRGSGTTDAAGEATVNFATPFPSVPKVFVTIIDAVMQGMVKAYNKTVNGFDVKILKSGHTHSFSDSFTTSGPDDTEWAVTDHLMQVCALGHAQCRESSKSRRKYATSDAKHTGSVSGTTGPRSGEYQVVGFDWIAVEGP